MLINKETIQTGGFFSSQSSKDAAGNQINYREYDVNPYTKGQNRGSERVVIGSDGKDGFFAGREKAGWFPVIAQHSTSSFVSDITAFLEAWRGSGGNNNKLIDDFINTMKNKYGVKVTFVK